MSRHKKQILSDLSGRRRVLVNMIGAACAIAIAMAVIIVASGYYIAPDLPQLDVSKDERTPFIAERSIVPLSERRQISLGARFSLDVPATAASTARFGFYVGSVPSSLESLYRHANDLDVLLPDWLEIRNRAGNLLQVEPSADRVRRWVRGNAPTLSLLPVLSGRPDDISMTLLNAQSRERLILEIATYLAANGDQGIAIAFENLPASMRLAYAQFVADLVRALHPSGRKVVTVLGPDEPQTWLQEMARQSDYVIVKLQRHIQTADDRGAPAPQGWLEQQISAISTIIPPAKLIIGLTSMAFDFSDHAGLRVSSVQAAWALMKNAGLQIVVDPASLNPRFSYIESTGLLHDVWLLDGVTMFNHLRAALAHRPAGVALWHLGMEDPTVWQTFARGRVPDEAAVARLATLTPGHPQSNERTFEVIQAVNAATPGKRAVHFSAALGVISDQSIIEIPTTQQFAGLQLNPDKLIALTFDDGPDRAVTERILDILDAKSAKATFFVLGRNARKYPETLRRIRASGHDIGNHTYSHPNLLEVSPRDLEIELNATQRVLEAQLGIHTTLFRPPFNGGNSFEKPGSIKLADHAARFGYLTVLSGVDSQDWMNPPPHRLHDIVVSKILAGHGQVVVMHDFGQRQATIEALPLIIDTLSARGYRFVAIHELINKPRDEIMPIVAGQNMIGQATLDFRSMSMRAVGLWDRALPLLAIIASALCILRTVFVLVSMLRHKRLEKRRASLNSWPRSVAVIVPAFNEEAVICRTVRSVLLPNRDNFEVIVVDDGSSDRSADIVRDSFADDPRVRVFKTPNGGKAAAANFALSQTDAEVIIAIDADTILAPDAIPLLVRHFDDPEVGAVAGTAVVGNPVNLLTRMQRLEYMIGQSIDRRAFAFYNANGIVPGAIGAWRRSALLSIGGYASDTLAEDADATFSVIGAGWKVVYEPRAEARTEAPETLTGFLKQRFRWMFGMLQVCAKHKSQLSQGTGLGILTIPNVVVFQFAFCALIPVLDIIAITSLVQAISRSLTASGENYAIGTGMATYAKFWILFQLIDLLAVIGILKLSGISRPLNLIPLLLTQRLLYWPLIHWTGLVTMLAAAKGQVRGWNKLNRTGRVVEIPTPPTNGLRNA